MNIGDFNVGQVVDLKFATVDATFAPITLAGTPAVAVYKGNSTTESTAGVALTVDFDSRTGSHHVRIDTSADGTFYAAAAEFFVVLTAGTVDGKSVVGQTVGRFSLQRPNAMLTAIAGYIDTEVAAIKAKTDNLPAAPAAVGDIPTANQNADALLDRAAGVEAGWTLRQAMRIMLSVLAGKASGLNTTTARFRDMADSKDRVVAAVDPDGNRGSVARDAS